MKEPYTIKEIIKILIAWILAKMVMGVLALCFIPFTLFMEVMEAMNIDKKEEYKGKNDPYDVPNKEKKDDNDGDTKET